MLGFLNTRVSTIAGIIVLLLVAGSVGVMIFWQFNRLMNVRIEMIELGVPEKL